MVTRSSVILEFDPAVNELGDGKRLADGLSAAVLSGDTLWVANDETASLERLSRLNEGRAPRYGDHRRFDLKDYLKLPVAPDSGKNFEVDIEGLDYRDGCLWLAGSHSRKRAQPRREEPGEAGVARLAKIRTDGNRYLLARIPVDCRDGLSVLDSKAEADGKVVRAARLAGDEKGNDLLGLLEDDEHLAPFLAIPGKDNGFDIEGLAVAPGGRVFLGLRGPVLRGWAVILELRVKTDDDDPCRLHLAKLDPDESNQRYRKHFLDLGGLGIRDLCLAGDDLLILAGVTMDLDGPAALFRWTGGARPEGPSLVDGSALQRLMSIPSGEGVDRPEGLALLNDENGAPAVLVVYDAAAEARKQSAHSVLADRYAVPAIG